MDHKEVKVAAIAAVIVAGAGFGMSVTSAVNVVNMRADIDAIEQRAEQDGHVDAATLMAALETPCATEDSDDCFWLSGTNGAGVSFVNVEGNIFPLTSVLEG